MRVYELQKEHRERFPYRTLRTLAWCLFILATLIFVLGVVDLAWTASNYGQLGCVATWNTGLQIPCMHANLGWTWAASPIWTSIFVIVCGVFGARISRWRYRSLRFWRNAFGVTAALVAILFAPLVIILSALEVHFGTGIFYYTPVNQQRMYVEDTVKLAIPIVIALLGLFEMIIALSAMSTVLCCAPIRRDDEYEINPRTRSSVRSYGPMASYHEPPVGPRYGGSMDSHGYHPSGTWPRGGISGQGFKGASFGGFSNFLPLHNPKPLPYAFNVPPQVWPVHTRNQVALPGAQNYPAQSGPDGLPLMPTSINRNEPLVQHYPTQPYTGYPQQQQQQYQQPNYLQPDGYGLRTHPERPFIGWVKEYPNMAGELMR